MSDISRRLFLGFLGVALSGCGRDGYKAITAAPPMPEGGLALQSPLDALEAYRAVCSERNAALIGNVLSTAFTSQKFASPYNDTEFTNSPQLERTSLVGLLESGKCDSFEVDTSRVNIDVADGVAMASEVDVNCRIRTGSEDFIIRNTVLARLVSTASEWKLERLIFT